MGNIERSEHYVCPQCGCADMRETTRVEAIAALGRDRHARLETCRQQLEGAVEALRAIVAELEWADHSPADASARAALTCARAALDRIRGQ